MVPDFKVPRNQSASRRDKASGRATVDRDLLPNLGHIETVSGCTETPRADPGLMEIIPNSYSW
jgi:hypothetical protein